MLKRLKERAARQAQRLIDTPRVQRAIAWADDTKRRVSANLSEARRVLAEAMQTEGLDDLESLKRDLDRMVDEDRSEEKGKA